MVKVYGYYKKIIINIIIQMLLSKKNGAKIHLKGKRV